ncbi:class I SAM-dependent methyltransferase [Microbacterium murale]|uniref:SAM-dependent methyltransferase n=1 Tax=Microbacterium murale TaxID=1081040 RepID=A0ABU0P4J6_9MICO|nr:class I SAM-dependent methyltransferase [Microbacterium murale]MDQ0642259.1 SAM-dependent methyltransferase [Microbacterium murale]
MTDASIAAAYDERAAEYIEIAGEIAQMDAADRERISTWRDASSGRLLDAGCGPGIWTEFLHDGHRDVVGVDISAAFLAAARFRAPGLVFQRASLRALPFEDASLGGILAWYSVIHTPPEDVPAILAEFARVLAPGGSLLLGYFEGPPREDFAHAVAPAYFWSADALSALLADAGLAVVSTERRDRVPGEVSHRPHGALTARRL